MGSFIEKPFALLNFPLMWEIVNYAPPTLQSPLVEWPGVQNPKEEPMTCGLEYVSCPLQFFFFIVIQRTHGARSLLTISALISYKTASKLATE